MLPRSQNLPDRRPRILTGTQHRQHPLIIAVRRQKLPRLHVVHAENVVSIRQPVPHNLRLHGHRRVPQINQELQDSRSRGPLSRDHLVVIQIPPQHLPVVLCLPLQLHNATVREPHDSVGLQLFLQRELHRQVFGYLRGQPQQSKESRHRAVHDGLQPNVVVLHPPI